MEKTAHDEALHACVGDVGAVPWLHEEARAEERELCRWRKSESKKPECLQRRSGEDEAAVRRIEGKGEIPSYRGRRSEKRIAASINTPAMSHHAASSGVMHMPPSATTSKGAPNDGLS
jgi:hypothetical protein